MSAARRPHVLTGRERRQAHIEWLKLIEVSGPFLSVPVLTAEWPDLEPLDGPARDQLRRAHGSWQENPGRNRSTWIDYVLGDLLGWSDAVQRDGLDAFAFDVPMHETTITPSFALTDPSSGQVKLLGLVSDSSPVARILGSDWPATPADRLAELCRHRNVELGLATDGRWWTLIWAPTGGVTTLAVFDAISWPDSAERDVVRAFVSLLERRRFLAVPPERQLPALLRKSLRNQEEMTERLGVQVRQAVELLVAAFARANLSSGISAQEVYRGAVTVMMRLVFVLFAEESLLLPADNQLYARSYSVGGLYAELERRVADARGNEGELEHTRLAWHRLLALFTVVYQGVSHEPELKLIAHDGSLFDPTSFPWIPLTVDDRTVLHMLRAVQTVSIGRELRTVSFRTLTVEEIGYVYEGLLSYEGFRAAETVVGLIGKEGSEAEVPLSLVESLASAASGDVSRMADALALKYKDTGIGSVKALTAKLASLDGDERARAETRLYAVTQDLALTRRLLPFYRIIRQDLRGDPVVILPGALYVTDSALRASSGTHYTPKNLAERVAEGALEPLVYSPGPLQTADRGSWRLVSKEQILGLRVADIAMGSGAFLVAACRYLAGKLIEAWSVEGNVDAAEYVTTRATESGLDLDTVASPLVIKARRQIIEHCLYGVDINPMAVEMAKLALWLVSMDASRPFTFLDDKLVMGDSLLGITSVEQLEWMHLSVADGRALHEGTLPYFMHGVRQVLGEVAADRVNLVGLPDDNLDDVNKKRRILAELRAKTRKLELYADLISGAALSGGKYHPWRLAANLANEAAMEDKVSKASEQAETWLVTDLPTGGFERDPLHWPLVFPEVFDSALSGRSGFDAVISNPPFLHGSLTRRALGHAYREFLVEEISRGYRKNADLVAFFVLRCHALLSIVGTTGLIATSSLAQGDAREISLDRLVSDKFEIRRAVANERWPTKNAAVRYCIVGTCVKSAISPTAERILDRQLVENITPMLTSRSRTGELPSRLAKNMLQSFQGSKIESSGFIVSPQVAEGWISGDQSYGEVVFPYLDGKDLNNAPLGIARRRVINFRDWPLEKAAQYRVPYAYVVEFVKPERMVHKEKNCRDKWWCYKRPTIDLYNAISSQDRVIALARVSSTLIPMLVSSRQVFHEKVIVFTSSDSGFLASLSSAVHYWWADEYKTTHGAAGDIQYSNARCFETLPLSEITREMRELGVRLDTFRRELMLARQAGLTATYNLVHHKRCTDADIAELRETHRAIDVAVVRAYGWGDLLVAGLDHGFHDTRQGPRYTVGPGVRQEILDRLLELNHERYAAEVAAGLHDKRTKSRKRSVPGQGGDGLF